MIDAIEKALNKVGFEDILVSLDIETFIWEEAYPIAVVHDICRIQESDLRELFQAEGLLDEEGNTPRLWTNEMLNILSKKAPKYLQTAALVCLKKRPTYPQEFLAKYPKDFWKKLQDASSIEGVIEYATFDKNIDKCHVEFALREVMRKRKEVNVLKGVGYVWIAEVFKETDIDEVMAHYFGKSVKRVFREDKCLYIGWSSTLKEVNMRYFVCPPSS